jgi:hypothetical protein
VTFDIHESEIAGWYRRKQMAQTPATAHPHHTIIGLIGKLFGYVHKASAVGHDISPLVTDLEALVNKHTSTPLPGQPTQSPHA